MNKRGDIPVTVLIIGVVFLCGLALFSFYNATTKTRNTFVGITLMERMNSQIEQNDFDEESSDGLTLDVVIEEGRFWNKQEKTIFSVEYKYAP